MKTIRQIIKERKSDVLPGSATDWVHYKGRDGHTYCYRMVRGQKEIAHLECKKCKLT